MNKHLKSETQNSKLILAIDTSCDETAVAISHGRRILTNVIASQVELHKKYGGVYPIEAKRAHAEKIDDVITEALTRTKLKIEDIDYLAVTIGPGLAPALEIGIEKIKSLAQQSDKPVIAVNHMEGHLLSCLAQNSKGTGKYASNNLSTSILTRHARKTGQSDNLILDPFRNTTDTPTKPSTDNLIFPALGFLISGGHTQLILIKAIGKYEILGTTLDDAAGECLDKVARMLGLGYPGGAIIEDFAQKGNTSAIDLPVPMHGKPGLNFSFSGLKTAALYEIRAKQNAGNRTMPTGGDQLVQDIQWGLENLDKQFIYDMCVATQDSVIQALLYRLKQAIHQYQPNQIWLGGGVAANNQLKKQLRNLLKTEAPNITIGLPYDPKLYGDNAAMIANAAYFQSLRNEFVTDLSTLDRLPRLSL